MPKTDVLHTAIERLHEEKEATRAYALKNGLTRRLNRRISMFEKLIRQMTIERASRPN